MNGPRLVTATFAAMTQRPDALIGSSRSGPFLGQGIYNLSSWHQTLHERMRPGSTALFFIHLHNSGNVPDVYSVFGTGPTPDVLVRYFVGTLQITREVRAGSYAVAAGIGGSRGLRVEVTVPSRAALGSSFAFSLIVSSQGDPAKKDAVRGVVSVAKA